MKKNAYIIGSGGQARVLLALLKDSYKNNYNIKKIYSIEKKLFNNDLDLGVPVTIIKNISNIKKKKSDHYFIAIGDIAERSKLFNKLMKKNFNLPNLISNKSHVDPTANLGVGNIILPFAHIGPFTKIGDNNLINTNANIEHEVSLGDHNNINPGAIICGRSAIKNKNKIGANAVIIENISISDGIIIGSGSVLTKNVKLRNKTLIGVPAKIK